MYIHVYILHIYIYTCTYTRNVRTHQSKYTCGAVYIRSVGLLSCSLCTSDRVRLCVCLESESYIDVGRVLVREYRVVSGR